MRPPDPDRAAAPAGGTGADRQSGGDQLNGEDTLPADLLASPTIGAWRRAHGITGWCDEARIAFARALADEAIRQAAVDPVIGVLDAIRTQQRVDLIARRLYVLALRLDPGLVIDDGRSVRKYDHTGRAA